MRDPFAAHTMREFRQHVGIAAPLPLPNIDTDTIIPSREMKHVSKTGLAQGLFSGWRYLNERKKEPNPEFVLNQHRYRETTILVTGENFGCGSSREHAVWALLEYGIRSIIAPSFGRIFLTNCVRNGILPAAINENQCLDILSLITDQNIENRIEIDLEKNLITLSNGKNFQFELNSTDRENLLNGWDMIDKTLINQKEIIEFEKKDQPNRPWQYR